jgi:glycosyltransferase involved in cell wall biosynthesis
VADARAWQAAGLKVAVVSAYPPSRNSLNEFGSHLVRHLAEHESVREVVVIADRDEAPADAADAARPPAADAAPVTVERVWRFNALDSAVRIRRALARHAPDAVIFSVQFATFGDRKVPGALGLLAPAAVRRVDRPVTVVLHNLADRVDLSAAGFTSSRAMAAVMHLAGRMLTRMLLRADLLALTIPSYVDFVRESYRARNAVLAPHGTFEVAPPPDFDVRPTRGGRRSILAFGKFGTYKRLDVLIAAYRELLGRGGYDDVDLVLAGTDSPNSPGYMAGIARENADLGHLVLTGYVAEEDVPVLFREATAVAFPYVSTTGSSGVLHQAGEHGCAAVLPRVGDLVHTVEDEGYCGEYFEPGDSGDLADALARVLDDDALRADLARRNYAAAAALPMSDVVHWHLLHLRRLLAEGTAA